MTAHYTTLQQHTALHIPYRKPASEQVCCQVLAVPAVSAPQPAVMQYNAMCDNRDKDDEMMKTTLILIYQHQHNNLAMVRLCCRAIVLIIR